MSYSATTGKLGLPQWVKGTKDHPDFLTDMNQAFEKIDGFAERTDNTVDRLPEQVDELSALVESMQEDVGEHTTEIASLGVRTGVLETNTDNLGVRVGNLTTRVGDLEEESAKAGEIIYRAKRLEVPFKFDSYSAYINPIRFSRDGSIVELQLSGDYGSAPFFANDGGNPTYTVAEENSGEYMQKLREIVNVQMDYVMPIQHGLLLNDSNKPYMLYSIYFSDNSVTANIFFQRIGEGHIRSAIDSRAYSSFVRVGRVINAREIEC